MKRKSHPSDQPFTRLLFKETIPIAKLTSGFIKVMPSLGRQMAGADMGEAII